MNICRNRSPMLRLGGAFRNAAVNGVGAGWSSKTAPESCDALVGRLDFGCRSPAKDAASSSCPWFSSRIFSSRCRAWFFCCRLRSCSDRKALRSERSSINFRRCDDSVCTVGRAAGAQREKTRDTEGLLQMVGKRLLQHATVFAKSGSWGAFLHTPACIAPTHAAAGTCYHGGVEQRRSTEAHPLGRGVARLSAPMHDPAIGRPLFLLPVLAVAKTV